MDLFLAKNPLRFQDYILISQAVSISKEDSISDVAIGIQRS